MTKKQCVFIYFTIPKDIVLSELSSPKPEYRSVNALINLFSEKSRLYAILGYVFPLASAQILRTFACSNTKGDKLLRPLYASLETNPIISRLGTTFVKQFHA